MPRTPQPSGRVRWHHGSMDQAPVLLAMSPIWHGHCLVNSLDPHVSISSAARGACFSREDLMPRTT